jgi:signal transduction histidine kinase
MSTSGVMVLLKQFFEVPHFEDEAIYRRAQLLGFFINLYLGVGICMTIFYSTIGFRNYLLPVIALSSCIPALGLRLLMRRGQVLQAATIFMGMLVPIIPIATLLAKSSVGTAVVTALQFISVVMAGLLLGRKGLLVFLLLTIFFNGIMIYAEFQHLYQVVLVREPFLLWTTQTICYVGTAMLMWEANRLINASFSQAGQELAERGRMSAREKNRTEMLEKVIGLGKSVTEVTDLLTVLRRIWDGVRNDLDFDRVGLFLYDPQNNTMQGTYGTDLSGRLVDTSDFRFPLDPQSLFQKVLSRPDGLYFTPDYDSVYQPAPGDEMSGVKHFAAVAVWMGDKPLAVMCVDQFLSSRAIGEEQLEGLRLFAGYAGLAIENSRLNSELERRVEKRTAQLEAANHELEAFSYSVSHDLRAPLRSINGFSKILDEEYSSEFNLDARGFLQKIIASGARMGHLIDDLLDFSRLGRRALQKQDVDLNVIIRTVIELLELEISGHSIEWSVDELPSAYADPALLQQVYANLIGNAVKYSRNRNPARIEIGSFSKESEIIYFVRDNGAGFDMNYAEKLFGVFQRLHRDDEFEGTGIGLATVQHIIQRHGGRIWAEAQVDQGATFYFTLID